MKAIIQAGGLGTRLRPVTYEIPKPLVPVKKQPIANHLVALFARHGVDEVGVLVSKAHEEDFRRWLKHWKDELNHVKISIFVEETPRGTFGGMQPVAAWLGSDPFFFSNGDELKDFDLHAMKEFHHAHEGVATLALVEVPNPHEYGVPLLAASRITEFLEKPNPAPSPFINSGLYILDPKIFGYTDFSADAVSIEKDVFPKLASAGKLVGFKVENGRWYDCGNLERWEKAIKEW